MACGATLSLKRNLEFDPVHGPSHRSPKRRRCMPMTLSSSTPPTKQHQLNPSPFTEVAPKLTAEQIAAHLGAEVKRMQHRKQLLYPGSPCSSGSSTPPMSISPPPAMSASGICAQPTCALPSSSTSSPSLFTSLSPSKKDAPLFTFRQVSLVCERMLKEREDQIRHEYNSVLTNKLAEQYENFLKFNHDQLHRRLDERPASYVS